MLWTADSGQRTADSGQRTADSGQRTAINEYGFSSDALAERKKELLEVLRQTAPELISDNQLDLERLQTLLGEENLAPTEHYELNWAGKTAARREIQKTTSHTLLPSSDNPEQAQHMLIEGENLEVLRVLQKSYYGKVKMIYIDPPYNTGNDSFVYPDDYSETLDEYQRRTGEKNEAGFLNKQSLWKKNSKESGQYHSAWLSMMYPRLYLARNLLRDDGVIFISIDDNEQANLKLLCDEVFGAENFINTISVNMKNVAGASGGGDDKRLKKNIEYLHIYARSKFSFSSFVNAYDYFPISTLVEEYREEGKSWKYTSVLVDAGQKIEIGSTVDGDGNQIKVFERQGFIIRSIGKIQREEGISEAEVYNKYAAKIFQTAMPQSSIRPRVMSFVAKSGGMKSDLYSIEYTPRSGRNKGVVYEQFYKGDNFRLFAWLRDVAEERDGVLYKKEMRGTYWNYASETKNLNKEGGVEFKNGKKPLAMLRRILEMQSEKDSVVLDFFAGSGTTAHAVMELNAEDGGNRQSISVQLPEVLEENSEAYNAGYRTIADITRARIEKVIAKLKAEQPDKTVDLACAHFTLSPSNFKVWQRDLADIEAVRSQLEIFQQAEKETDNQANAQTAMLTELLLKNGLGALGVGAISKTRKLECGVTVHRVQKTEQRQLWLCFEPYVDELREEIVKAKPAQVILLNSCFTGDKADEQLSNLQLELAGLDIGLLVI